MLTSMASGTLERCSLHRWIPGFHCTGQMADSVYGVVWVSGLLMSTLWIEWPMVAGGVMVWAGVCYGQRTQVHFIDGILNAQRYCDEILRPIVVPFIHDHHLMLQHDNATAPCCKDLYTILGSWKHPSSCMASILTRHVTHWACFGCSGSAYKTACSSSCQYPATSHSYWRGVDQHSTGHNQQLINAMRRRCVATAWGKWWSHQTALDLLTVFGPPPPNTVKLHIFEWPFIVASLRHICAIIMLSNQHLDMPHLWGGWIISAKEKCSLTQI